MRAVERTVFHLVARDEWAAAESSGRYAPASLDQEGFIHFSTARQVAETAARFFAGRADLLLVEVRADLLTAPLRFDEVDTGDRRESFPHLYGPLNLDAVVAVKPWSAPAE
jgi:uncharacterized protein (DUF952 family)